MNTSYRLGIDVGGTFTDFVLVDQAGKLTETKTPSTPSNPGEAISKGLVQLSESLGISADVLLRSCSMLIHGTTVAVNALIEHRGAKTGLICTAGFRDSLEIRLGYRDASRRYAFGHPPPPALVPRHLRLPVRERIDKNGEICVPLVEDDVHDCIEVFKKEGVEAIAVSLLWSFYNPVHEQRIGAIIRDEMPDAYLSVSSEVAPRIGEYDRTSTTVVNAYVGPILLDYMGQTENLLKSLGYGGGIRYIQSNGGIAIPEIMRSRPIQCLNSGPAAAPVAGLFYGRLMDEQNLITIDMGGTSFDACLIDNGHPNIKDVDDVHGYRVVAPMIDVNTVGAGGGSITWLDAGILRVGPQSAGAVPGPACYDRGGSEPTVTDADVVLGYLNAEYLLGGRFPIDAKRAHGAITEKIAEPLGISVEEASRGIFEVVNRNMANAISEVSLERGYDPRDFIAVAAGGQGAVHVGAIVKDLNIHTIIIPQNASTFCAFGAIVTDFRHDYKRSHAVRLSGLDANQLEREFQKMENTGYAELALEGVSRDETEIIRKLDMRYVEQVYEVSVDVSGLILNERSPMELRERLDMQHEKEYTYRHEEGEGEIVNATVTMIGRVPKINLPTPVVEDEDSSSTIRGERPIFFNEYNAYHTTPVYNGSLLRPGNVVVGPAVVEEINTTIVVFPDWTLKLTPFNCYLMRHVGVGNE